MTRRARTTRETPALGHPARPDGPRLALEPLEDRLTPTTVYALLPDNSIAAFGPNGSAAAGDPVQLAIPANETLVGIDVRPQTNQLYGITVSPVTGGSAVRLYAITVQTGTATPLTAAPVQFADGAGAPVPVTGINFGFDFNPAADRARVVADTGFNFRMNPNTGALVDGDGTVGNPLTPDGSVGGGVVPSGAAYTNNFQNSPGLTPPTVLTTLDATNDRLATQADPNAGTSTPGPAVTLNGAPLDFSAVNGFDFGPTADGDVPALAALTVGGTVRVYEIDTSTGAATDLGPLGFPAVNGLAILSRQFPSDTDTGGLPGAPVVGLSPDGLSLTRFNSSLPSSATFTLPITGVAAGEALVGLDARPATGQVLALGVNAAADTATLYRLDPQTGVATPIGTPGVVALTTDGTTAIDLPAVADADYGFDIDPRADQVVTTSAGLNFRIDPVGGTAVDGDNGGAAEVPGTNPDRALPAGLSAVAFVLPFGSGLVAPQLSLVPPAPVPRFFGLDPAADGLVPFTDSVTLAGLFPTRPLTLAGAPLDFTAAAAFDIAPGAGHGLAVLTVGGVSGLYRVGLATAEATRLGDAPPLRGVAAGQTPAGRVSLSASAARVSERDGSVTVTATRAGGDSGDVLVILVAERNGTTRRTEFVIRDGDTTASVPVLIGDDGLDGPDSPLTVTATLRGGAVFETADTLSVTVLDDDDPAVVPPLVNSPGAVGLVAGNRLVRFRADRPGQAGDPFTLTGLAEDETLVGVDFRPQNGVLYGLATSPARVGGGVSVRLYAIDPAAATATPLTSTPVTIVGPGIEGDAFLPPALTPALTPITGTRIGFDFDPVSDRARVTTDTGINFRMDPNSGFIVFSNVTGGRTPRSTAPRPGRTGRRTRTASRTRTPRRSTASTARPTRCSSRARRTRGRRGRRWRSR